MTFLLMIFMDCLMLYIMERVDFGKTIGNYVDPDTGTKYPTTVGIIHYSKSGTHIVSARPKEE